jgi:hypothetical protein
MNDHDIPPRATGPRVETQGIAFVPMAWQAGLTGQPANPLSIQ